MRAEIDPKLDELTEKIIAAAFAALSAVHSAQLLNYLKASRLPIGLLFNFGKPRVEMKRVIL